MVPLLLIEPSGKMRSAESRRSVREVADLLTPRAVSRNSPVYGATRGHACTEHPHQVIPHRLCQRRLRLGIELLERLDFGLETQSLLRRQTGQPLDGIARGHVGDSD